MNSTELNRACHQRVTALEVSSFPNTHGNSDKETDSLTSLMSFPVTRVNIDNDMRKRRLR